METISK